VSDYSVFDHFLEGCQIIGFDWRFLYINDAAAKHNRRPKKELLSKKYMDIWPGIQATEVFEIVRRCMEERIALQTENEFVFPDGTKGWFSLSIQPIPEGVLILSIDIAERKQVEDALVESEKRTKVLLNALPDMMFRMDRNGVILDYKSEKSNLNSESEDIIGRRNRDITPPEFADLLEHYINAALTTGEMQIFNYQLPVLDHGLRDYEARMVASGTDEVTEIVRDITERKRSDILIRTLNQAALLMQLAASQKELFLSVSGELSKVGLSCAILILDESQTFLIPKYTSYNSRAIQVALKLTGINFSTFRMPIASVDAFRQPIVERQEIFLESMVEILQQVLPAPIKSLASQVASLLKIPKTINVPLVVEDKVIGLFSVQGEDLRVNDIPTITSFANQVAAGWFRSKLFELAQSEIDERKRGEEAFRKLSQKDEEALQIARMGHWELDLTTNQFTFNDQYYLLHGTTAEEAGGYIMSAEKFTSRYVHPDDSDVIGETVRRIIETNDPNLQFQVEARILRADGEPRDVKVWIRSEKDTQGRITKIRGVNQDITERKKGEKELILANQELLFQNEEKEKRAAELIVANQELIYQNEEKEKRAAELIAANEETTHQLQNIQALYTIDQAITGSFDLDLTLNVLLEQIKTRLNVDAAAVLLLNPHAQLLEFAAGIGFRGKEIEHSRPHLGEGLGGRVALERKTVSAINLLKKGTQFISAPLLVDEDFATYSGTPLIAKGQVNGVLEVYHRSPFEPDENWLEFFKVLAGQTAIAVDSANLFTELRLSNTKLFVAYDSTIEGWSHALDLRDKETEGHTQRVTEMTMKLARAAGITEEELVHVRRGALLHDIGKMGVPDHILLKPGKLTDEEWVVMRKHTTFAFELLSPIAYLRPALDIPYCHHEKWDGSGYPRGLKGEQIPLVARLFSIVDVWDALLSDRPYRQGWPKEKVIEHIKSLSGTHFDPKAVELFLKVLNEDEKNAG
jgi:putative nucleotidyltransferase with HDIG domain/PAS domain S-box-containing protein